MKASDARNTAVSFQEAQKKAYDEYMNNQIQRVTGLIEEKAKLGYCSICINEQVQQPTKKWLLDNGYKMEDKSTKENYYFIIIW